MYHVVVNTVIGVSPWSCIFSDVAEHLYENPLEMNNVGIVSAFPSDSSNSYPIAITINFFFQRVTLFKLIQNKLCILGR